MLKNKHGNRILSLVLAFAVISGVVIGALNLPVSSLTEILPEKAAAIQITYSDTQYYDYSKIVFEDFGTNLVADSTVSQFDESGTYKSYYDLSSDSKGGAVLNANAWWDKVPNIWQYFYAGVMDYASMKTRGYLSNNAALSHTNDNSGVLTFKAYNSVYLPLPKMNAKKYYLVTVWINQAEDITLKTGIYDSNLAELNTSSKWAFPSGWQRVSWLYYTGANEQIQPVFYMYTNTSGYIDDVAVYELDDDYGAECEKAGKLVSEDQEPEPELPEEEQAKQITVDSNGISYDYSEFDWESLGTNLIPDPAVSQFENGVYKSYYDLEADNKGGVVLDPNAWWDKAPNRYQQFYNNSDVWVSPKIRSILTDKTSLSHKSDGSGAIILPADSKQKYLPLPIMERKSYYLVTFWVKIASGKDCDIAFEFTTDDAVRLTFQGTGDWSRISFVVYTGASFYNEPNIRIYNSGAGYADDFAVYKLEPKFAERCLKTGKLVYEKLSAVSTEAIDGYDFQTDDNMFAEGSFEENGFSLDSAAKYGDKVLKISKDNNTVKLPELELGTYYLVSYWLKAEASQSVSVDVISEETTVYTFNSELTTDWKQSMMIINSGDSTDASLKFVSSAADSNEYVDGISLHKLPEDVSIACSALDKSSEDEVNLDKLNISQSVFGKEIDYESKTYKKWRGLTSPVKSGSSAVTYVSLYEKYYYISLKKDRLNRGFAPSGYGERRYYSGYTCKDEDNLVGNSACDSASYWENSSGYVTVSHEEHYDGDTSLKVNGNGVYRKRITGLKENTCYYLSLYGMSDSENGITDINFGIMDTEGHRFENPISKYESSEFTRNISSKQEITILCPDGTWYNRTYCFYTEENTEVDFFVTGTSGIMYLDDIRIYEKSKAIETGTLEDYDDIIVFEYEEANYACDEKNNLIPNGSFDKGTEYWSSFKGINKIVEVATSQGNKMLHYKSSDMCYYYMAKAEIEADKYYTFSFWTMNLNGKGAKFGIASLDNPRAFISTVREVSADYGEWQLISIRFKAYAASTVCLALYDNGGEAVFDKVRLFESNSGYQIDPGDDMPVGGTTFSDSVLGSDGLQKTSDSNPGKENNTIASDNHNTDMGYVSEDSNYESEEKDSNETEEVVTKVLKKVKKPTSTTRLATWFIVLLIVLGAIILCAAAVLIIFFIKKKKTQKSNQLN